MELMERLKKVAAELQQAKREASPTFDEKSLYQSRANQSFIKNLSSSRSRMNQYTNESIVEQHSKAVGML